MVHGKALRIKRHCKRLEREVDWWLALQYLHISAVRRPGGQRRCRRRRRHDRRSQGDLILGLVKARRQRQARVLGPPRRAVAHLDHAGDIFVGQRLPGQLPHGAQRNGRRGRPRRRSPRVEARLFRNQATRGEYWGKKRKCEQKGGKWAGKAGKHAGKGREMSKGNSLRGRESGENRTPEHTKRNKKTQLLC